MNPDPYGIYKPKQANPFTPYGTYSIPSLATKTPVYVNPATKNATTGGDSYSAPSQPVPSIDTSGFLSSAQADRERTLGSIQNRLNEVRRLAGEKLGQATQDRDYIMESISTRFPELINRAESRRTESLGELDTEERKLGNIYDRANAQARRRTESAGLKNRMLARAGNRLGSSFYDDIVAENQEGLIRTLGESDLERADKVAAVGNRKGETNRYFDESIKDIEYTKEQATQQALRDYDAQVREAQALERAGVLDFGEAQAVAESNLSSRLDQINQWAMNIAAQRQSLDAAYGRGTQAINSFQTYNDPLNTALSDTDDLTGLQAFAPNMLAGGGRSGGTNNLAYLLGFGRSPEEEKTLGSIMGRFTA
jgi:hypothetical protein